MGGSNIDWNGISNFTLFSLPQKKLHYECVTLSRAAEIYKNESYLDASTACWEIGRNKIIELNFVEEWKKTFYQAQIYAKAAFNGSFEAQRLISTLDIDRDLFIQDLPCVGAAMERLIWQEWGSNFFNQALEIYNSGYWICGYNKNTYIICGEY